MGLPNYIVNLDELAEELIKLLEGVTVNQLGSMYSNNLQKSNEGWIYTPKDNIIVTNITIDTKNLSREYELKDSISIEIGDSKVNYETTDFKNTLKGWTLSTPLVLQKETPIIIKEDRDLIESCRVSYFKQKENDITTVKLKYVFNDEEIHNKEIYVLPPKKIRIPDVGMLGYKNFKNETISINVGERVVEHIVECTQEEIRVTINCIDENNKLIHREFVNLNMGVYTVEAPILKGYEVIGDKEREIDTTHANSVVFMYRLGEII